MFQNFLIIFYNLLFVHLKKNISLKNIYFYNTDLTILNNVRFHNFFFNLFFLKRLNFLFFNYLYLIIYYYNLFLNYSDLNKFLISQNSIFISLNSLVKKFFFLKKSKSNLKFILFYFLVFKKKYNFFLNFNVLLNINIDVNLKFKFFMKYLNCLNFKNFNIFKPQIIFDNSSINTYKYLYFSKIFKKNNELIVLDTTNNSLIKNFNLNFYFIEFFFKKVNKILTSQILGNYNFFLFQYYVLFKLNNFSDNNVSSNNLFAIKNFFFFDIFVKKFFEEKLQKPIYLSFVKNNVDFLNYNIYYLNLIKRIKKLQIFNKYFRFIKEFLEILILTFYTKDIFLFKNWLIKVSEKLHFKVHKRLFYIIKVIVMKYFSLYFKYFNCLGFCLRVKGKIGLGGSSKTKTFWIKVGKFSLTKKNLKVCYTNGHIRTYSGVLGVEIILSYI